MNPDSKLLKLYDYWRVLTEGERDAIHSSDWVHVAELQSEKRRLQEEIVAAGETAAAALGVPAYEPRYHTVGEKLIVLETENAEAVATQRQRTEAELQTLDRASRNLHQVHHAYVHGLESVWESYS